MRPGLLLFVGIALFSVACGAPASKTAARDLPPVTLVASANDQVTVTLHFDSSVTTRARVLAAVDEVVATI
ncbi:MAG: hypothetical protein AABM32_06520 [Chloroflexota bacterium]